MSRLFLVIGALKGMGAGKGKCGGWFGQRCVLDIRMVANPAIMAFRIPAIGSDLGPQAQRPLPFVKLFAYS
jgi:hypothetical protein